LRSILQNMEAKRVLVPSKDLFLAMKCVIAEEKLADKLLQLIEQDELVDAADILILMAHLVKCSGNTTNLLKPALKTLLSVADRPGCHMKQAVPNLCDVLMELLDRLPSGGITNDF
jgi:hypothetical protein